MSAFIDAFSAGAGFSPDSLNHFYQGFLGIMVMIWAGFLVKGFIQKAEHVSHAGSYLINQFAIVCVAIVVFCAVSYW